VNLIETNVDATGLVTTNLDSFVIGGTANWHSNSVTVADFTQLGGSYAGGFPGIFESCAALTITQSMDWTGGALSGPETTGVVPETTVLPGASVSMADDPNGVSYLFLDGRTLDIENGVTAQIYASPVVGNVGNSLTMSNGAVLTNEGDLTLKGDAILYGVGAAPDFTNIGTLIQAPNQGSYFSTAFDNSGTVLVQTGGVLNLNGGGNETGTFSGSAGSTLICGQVNTGVGDFIFAPSSSIVSAGTVSFGADTVVLGGSYDVIGSTYVSGGPTIESNVTMQGNWTMTGNLGVVGGTLTGSSLAWNNTSGKVYMDDGGILNVLAVPGDAFGTPGNTSTLEIDNGTLNAAGTINANVYNAGVFNPGGPGTAGLLTINGNFTQDTTGTWNDDIGGPNVGTQYDQLTISGSASISGTVNVNLINNYLPPPGSRFDGLLVPSLGFGATINGLNLPNGETFIPGYVNGVGFFAVPDTTTMVDSASAITLSFGQAVTVTATVMPNYPTTFPLSGSVDFYDTTNQTDLGTVALSANGTAGVSPTAPLPLGTQTIAISYSGATFFLPSSATVTVTVVPDILVLDPRANGSLSISGNARINVAGMVLVDSNSASALSASGNATVTASSIQVVGHVQKSGNATLSLAPVAGAASVPNPLAGLTGPSISGLTNYGSVSYGGNGSHTLNPGIYRQISVSGNATVQLNAGLYLIEGGGLTVSGNASISGTGIMIYNTSSNYPNNGGNFGGITLSGNGTFNLSASVTSSGGADAGILIFQPTANTRALSFSGNASAGITGTIYAPSAQVLISGNASLTGSLVADELSMSGNGVSTEVADGSGGSPLDRASAGTLLAGDLRVYVNDPAGYFTADMLNRIQDAINTWDNLLASYSVTITEVSDPALANVIIDDGTSSAAGSATDGVLGSYSSSGEITVLQGWNWYTGADPAQINANQYDFQTVVTHELGHALGVGGSADASSPMYEILAAGVVRRQPSAADLNIPEAPEGADAERAASLDPAAGFEQPATAASNHEPPLLAVSTNTVTVIAQSGVDPEAGNGRLTADARIPLKLDTAPLQAVLEEAGSVGRLPRDAGRELRERADESVRRERRAGKEEGLRSAAWIAEQWFQQPGFSGATSQVATQFSQARDGAADQFHPHGDRAETIDGPACTSTGQVTRGIRTEPVGRPAEAISTRETAADALFALWAAGLGLAIQRGELAREDNRVKNRA
jgi:hypothetical protein